MYDWAENVTIFSGELGKFEHDDINIYGIGFENFTSDEIDLSSIVKDVDKTQKNILLIHSSVDASKLSERAYNPISLNTLKNQNFDYIALRTYS